MRFLRNQTQGSTFLAQTVLARWFLAFDFGGWTWANLRGSLAKDTTISSIPSIGRITSRLHTWLRSGPKTPDKK
eukprot:855786-Rhodomonas_salina.1